MDLQLYDLIVQIFPHYIIILVGYLLGIRLHIDRLSLANILFYSVVPIVFLSFGMRLPIKADLILLPILFYLIGLLLNRIYFKFSSIIWPANDDNSTYTNIIAYSAGTANAGYIGLPIAMSLFDTQTVAVYMLMNVGMSLYDYTYGAYTVARSQFKINEAIVKILKLPILYGFFIGLFLNHLGFTLHNCFKPLLANLTGTYTFLGMLIIGLSLASIKRFNINLKFILVLLSARFITAPLLIFLLIFLDKEFLHIFDYNTHAAAILISIMPPATNTVIYATIYNAHSQEAASAVFAGTIVSLIYIPVILSIVL